MKKDELKTKLESLVREAIKSGEILNVIVNKENTIEDEKRITIKVIYNSKSKKLDPKEIAGITTKARRVLIEGGEEYFPVFYFILKSEAGKLIAVE